MRTITFLKFVLSVCLACIFITGCKKTNDMVAEPAAILPTTERSYYKTTKDLSFPMGVPGNNGTVSPFTSSGNTANGGGNCGVNGGLVSFTFAYFEDLASSCGGGRTITMIWYANVPAAINITSVTAGYGIDLPYTTSSASASYSVWGSYLDPSGVSMNTWRVEYSFTISNTAYCAAEYFSHLFSLGTDCSALQNIAPLSSNAFLDYFDTPNTYQVYPFYALNSPAPGFNFTAEGLTLACTNCHGPALGDSPSYEFKWWPAGSPGLSTTVSRTNISIFTVSVLAAGNYEYQSRGLVSPGTWDSWTAVQTVTVL